jgi:xanthine dehydrogenase accessory factor
MRKVLEFICAELQADRPVVGAVIVAASGSTPRSTGSRMAVAADGRSCGTVGGGPGEAAARKEAEAVHRGQSGKLLQIDLTAPEAAAEGMICGGMIDVLVEYIAADSENLRIFSDLLTAWEGAGPPGRPGVLLTSFRADGDRAEVIGRTLDPERLPDPLPEALCREVRLRAGKTRLPFAEGEAGFFVLVEPMQSPGTVLIAGAGHVGRATAALTASVGFHTIVLDDRADFLLPERFPAGCRLKPVSAFAGCFGDLTVTAEALIVILTRGHVHDKTVLAQALETPAGYIGMIGSRRKRDAIYDRLLEEGVSRAALERVHCPIGLDIGADTPEEIAVSITAELIRHRAGRG